MIDDMSYSELKERVEEVTGADELTDIYEALRIYREAKQLYDEYQR